MSTQNIANGEIYLVADNGDNHNSVPHTFFFFLKKIVLMTIVE